VLESNLTDHFVRDCGCETRRKRSREDLAGQRFGRLVAVRYEFDDKRHQPCWTFRCDCGTEKILSVNQVKWSGVQSCGCLRKERAGNLNKKDISGKRYGRLIAIRQTEFRDLPGTTVWECQCDCGNSAFYSLNELNSGKAKSCGCLYRESRKDCSKNRTDLVEETALSSLLAAKKIRSNNTSGTTGVHFDPKLGKWVAYISYRKKRYYLGVFQDVNDAVKARKRAEQKLHDPMIESNWDELSETRQNEYLAYLKGIPNNYPPSVNI